jgi:hemoglobin-like flavoprotein
MTPKQMQLITETFTVLARDVEGASGLFYTRLFELNPELRHLFKTSPRVQGYKLMVMLGSVVANLENLTAMVPVLQDLALRHVKYGVKEKDYGTVAEAMLWTLESFLGKAFTPEVREAWTVAYGFLESTMRKAVNDETRRRELV